MRHVHIFTVFYSLLCLSANSFASDYLTAKQHLNQRYIYDVYYKKISIGKMTQHYQQQGEQIKVDSRADLSFLYYSFGGQQQSNIYWNEPQQRFLNHSFSRQSSGFGASNISASFDNKAYQTVLLNDGIESIYHNEKEPIVDFNAINLQLSLGLQKGEQNFEFYMQTSDDISHYYFQVKGIETISTQFGNIKAYRVEQIKKSDRSFVAWFAPDWHYQMVKLHYKRKVLDIRVELKEAQF